MKHDANRCGVSKKMFIAMLALVLALGCAVGGTIAWLTANTDPVVNTFTYGDIKIKLYEHEYDAATNTLNTAVEVKEVNNYKIVPGKNLPKDPTVKVLADSEACWLFVKVEEKNWPTFTDADGAKKVSYAIVSGTDGWTKLTGVTGVDNVYYREVDAATAKAGVAYYVLAGDTTYPNGVVTVSKDLTKTEINDIAAENQPKLTFTAYAVQRDGIDNVTDAWAKVSPTVTP